MVLYKNTSYPFSFSLTEPEFRIALQGGYHTLQLTYTGNERFVEKLRVIEMKNLAPRVQKAKMKVVTAPPFKPYWVVHF